MPRNPNLNPKHKCKINVANALKDLRQHKENIACFGENAKQENVLLLKTLDKYKPVFDRHGLTDLVQFLRKDCCANDYVGVLRWLENLERELQRISMSNGHKSEQGNGHKSEQGNGHKFEQGHNGENEHGKAKCQQCPEMRRREGYRLLMELMAEAALEALAEAVINAMNDPLLDLRILLNPDYWYWLMMAVAILEENGIYINEN